MSLSDERPFPSADGAPAVKVCGLTDPDEAAACAALGALAIGVVFAQGSPRQVTVEQAVRVVAALPAGVARVGVFVDPAPELVASAVAQVGLTHVQLHGVGAVERLRAAAGDLPLIEGVRVDGPGALARARDSEADLVLLDAAVPGVHGGTGTRFDWELLEAAGPLGRPFGVAGGLSAANVGDAVRRLRPWVVDVSSGVERAPGRKDPDRVARFLAAVAAAGDTVLPDQPRETVA